MCASIRRACNRADLLCSSFKKKLHVCIDFFLTKCLYMYSSSEFSLKQLASLEISGVQSAAHSRLSGESNDLICKHPSSRHPSSKHPSSKHPSSRHPSSKHPSSC